MQKNLRAAALLVSLAASGCWSSSTPATTTPTGSDGSDGSVGGGTIADVSGDARATTHVSAPCVEAGERLLVQICRRADDDVEWTVTNRSDVPLWAFVAPPAGPVQDLDRGNAIAMMTDGKLLLRKFQVQPVGGEAVFVGAVLLAAGKSDNGTIRLGARLNTSAPNFTGAFAKGTTVIQSVELEVGFAERRPGDQNDVVPKSSGLVILPNFKRSRQEFARSPALSWR
jgi:hypothetical protein